MAMALVTNLAACNNYCDLQVKRSKTILVFIVGIEYHITSASFRPPIRMRVNVETGNLHRFALESSHETPCLLHRKCCQRT